MVLLDMILNTCNGELAADNIISKKNRFANLAAAIDQWVYTRY